jgi:hypothetical protein
LRNLFIGRLIVHFVEIFELAEGEGAGAGARRGLSAKRSRRPPFSALECLSQPFNFFQSHQIANGKGGIVLDISKFPEYTQGIDHPMP